MNRSPSKFTVFVALLLCFMSHSAHAQDAPIRMAEIVGKAYHQMVMDLPEVPGAPVSGKTTIEVPVGMAEVVVVAGKDTLSTVTDGVGAFRFKGITPGRVTLSMTNDTFAPFSESFELMPGENVVIITRQMKQELEAAVVASEAPVMTMKGDTLVYHAAAMNVQPGDFAMDLLKQMPGVEVRNRQIYVTGEAVRRTYVNGALVFGLDPMASMENLQADQVVAMEVYDERSPEEILDGVVRNKERVMNIRTKDPVFSSMDLQVRAIAGADQHAKEDGRSQLRYTAGTNAHFFSELKQLSLDYVTGNVGMYSSNINVTPTTQAAYLENTDLKLGYNRYWENALFGNAFQAAYSLGRQWTRSRSRQLQNYFETAGVPERTVDNEQTSTGLAWNHDLSTSYDYRSGRRFGLSWQQNLRLNRSENGQQTGGQITVDGGTPMLRDARVHGENRSWDLDESLSFSLKGKKPLPRISLNMHLGRNNLDAWDLDTLASSYSKRYLTKAGSGLSQSYNARIEQLLFSRQEVEGQNLRVFQVQGSYRFAYSSQQKQQEAYDLFGTPSPLINAANTYDFTYASLRHVLDVRTTYHRRDISFSAGVSAEAERVTDNERIPAFETTDKVFYRLLPSLSVMYKKVNLSFNTMARIPSVEQLRRRVDDSNPLSLIAGNPDLKQSITYQLTFSKNTVNPSSKQTLNWSIQGRMETRPIVSRMTFFPQATTLDDYSGYVAVAGSTLMRSENADHGYNASGNLTFSSRWSGPWRVTTQVSPSVSFRSTPQYYGETLDRTREFSPSFRASGTLFPLRSVTLSFDISSAYIRAWNGIGSMDRRVLRNRLSLSSNVDFLKNAFFTGNYSWDGVKDFDAGSADSNIHRLDLSVGVNLFQKKLRIALSGIDLLRGGSQYTVTMGPSSMTQVWRQVYGRYFLLDISYRFNNTGNNPLSVFGR